MAVLYIVIGAALLFFGRKVFWLFVAGAGFVAGTSLASNLFNGPDWLNIAIGLGVGLLAALLAMFLQRFAIGLAGFLVGGYVALQILPMLNLESGPATWVTFIVGGIIGVLLVSAVFDWALIILSSLAGAALVVGAVSFPQTLGFIVLIVLAAAGISYQYKELKSEKR